MKVTKNPTILYKDQTSVFDVSYKEIAKRQFFAGFMAGVGGALATLLVGAIVTVVIIGIVKPRLTGVLGSTRDLLEQAGFFPSLSAPSPSQGKE